MMWGSSHLLFVFMYILGIYFVFLELLVFNNVSLIRVCEKEIPLASDAHQ